jgi:hypothetical protein
MTHYNNNNDISLNRYDIDIRNLIITVRGLQVLLDSDIALLYGYETKAINQAANRNYQRFPPGFRFQLSAEEAKEVLKSQSVTSKKDMDLLNEKGTPKDNRGGIRKLPYVYSD